MPGIKGPDVSLGEDGNDVILPIALLHGGKKLPHTRKLVGDRDDPQHGHKGLKKRETHSIGIGDHPAIGGADNGLKGILAELGGVVDAVAVAVEPII